MRSSVNSGTPRAFTIVEMLIVVAVLAVLMALLLPAVQSIRSAGRRVACGNNMRQLAIGLQSFHTRNGQLPTFWGVYPKMEVVLNKSSRPFFGSWLAHILPDIDMQAEYLRLPKAKLVTMSFTHSYQQSLESSAKDGILYARNMAVGGGRSWEANTVKNSGGGSSSGTWVATGTTPGYMTASSTTTVPIYRYDRVLQTAFGMNGYRYEVWRTVQVQIGTDQQVRPGGWVPESVQYSWVGTGGPPPLDPRYGSAAYGSVRSNGNQTALAYFNLTGSTPYGQGYPAAQETISIPITTCLGDNSLIESTRKLPWLAGRNWSTTNYLANPHAFTRVSNIEAPVVLAGSIPAPTSPMGTGRYKVDASWEPRTFESITDGQSNTILLAEAMRYCTSVVYATGESFSTPENRLIDVARLAFWSSPALANVVDIGFPAGTNESNWPGSMAHAVSMAIQPHPNWDGTQRVSDSESQHVIGGPRMGLVPPEVSWKPWTHNFGIEWESERYQFANTFMFQSQPKPADCSFVRAQANHGNVLMVAMCDGSVRPIKSSISRREISDSETTEVGRDPVMGSGVAANNKPTQPDGAWDMLMKANDGNMPPAE